MAADHRVPLMSDMSARPAGALRQWFGGGQLLLLVLVVAVVAGGLYWERWRHPPVPAGATQVESALNVDIRQTSFRYPGTAAELLAHYQQAMPPRGWRYCGSQATPGCTNLTQLVDRAPEAIQVFRRADDQGSQGATVEIWAIETESGQLFVTVYETRGE
jgi:hypothetical protein